MKVSGLGGGKAVMPSAMDQLGFSRVKLINKMHISVQEGIYHSRTRPHDYGV